MLEAAPDPGEVIVHIVGITLLFLVFQFLDLVNIFELVMVKNNLFLQVFRLFEVFLTLCVVKGKPPIGQLLVLFKAVCRNLVVLNEKVRKFIFG